MLFRSTGLEWPFIESLVGGWRDRSLFDSLRRCAVFLGYPRGGGSLLGALLNAHPQTCLSADAGLLRYLHQGYRRSQLLWLVYRKDRAAGRGYHRDGDYRFAVPGQWQGCFESLRVIGDVRAGCTTDWLDRHPESLDNLRLVLGLPLRLILLVRDPLQVILSQHRRYPHIPLRQIIDDHFRRCGVMERFARQHPDSVLVVRVEELLASPAPVLSSLCAHLGVEAESSYLDACQLVVNELTAGRASDVRASRAVVGRSRVLNRSLLERIERQAERFSFLNAYRDSQQAGARRAA